MRTLWISILCLSLPVVAQSIGKDGGDVYSGLAIPGVAQIRCMANSCIRISIKHPAIYEIKLDRVAFMIDSASNKPEGKQIAREIADRLTEKFATVPGVTVVSREHVERIFTEQNFSVSGLVDDNSTIDMGKMIGASTMLMVKVRQFGSRQTKLDALGIETFKTSFKISAFVQAVDFETGKIIAAVNISVEPGKTNTAGYPAPDQAKDLAIDEVIEKTAGNFVPWFETKNMIVFKAKKYSMLATHNALKVEEYDEALLSAIEGFEEAIKDTGGKPKDRSRAVYNYGVVQYCLGNFKDAQLLFKRAWKINNRKMYLKAINEVKLSTKYSKKDE